MPNLITTYFIKPNLLLLVVIYYYFITTYSTLLLLISTIYYYLFKLASPTLIYKISDVRGIFRKKISFCGCMYLKHFEALKVSIKSLLKCLLRAQNARE